MIITQLQRIRHKCDTQPPMSKLLQQDPPPAHAHINRNYVHGRNLEEPTPKRLNGPG